MIKSWRLLAMAAALHVTAGVSIAAAQTIIVRHAPPDETVEAVLNATKVATAQVTTAGDATPFGCGKLWIGRPNSGGSG